jgi:hypothetical protein
MSSFWLLCSAPDSNFVSRAERSVYSVLIATFQVYCVPMHGVIDGIWCAIMCYRREWEVLYAIAQHRIPTNLGRWHTGFKMVFCLPNVRNSRVFFIAMLRFEKMSLDHYLLLKSSMYHRIHVQNRSLLITGYQLESGAEQN